jgi:hypothetical protein
LDYDCLYRECKGRLGLLRGRLGGKAGGVARIGVDRDLERLELAVRMEAEDVEGKG